MTMDRFAAEHVVGIAAARARPCGLAAGCGGGSGHHRHGGRRPRPIIWPVFIGLDEGLLRRRGPQSRRRLRAVERAAGAADHRRLARHLACRPAWSIRCAPSAWARRSRSCASRCRRRLTRCWPSRRSSALTDLKGKMISLGGPKDITRIYVERMLAPHGVKPGEFDMVFAGRHRGARRRRCWRARSTRRSCCRRSISRPGGGLQPISGSPSTTSRTCRSPAPWSTSRLGGREPGDASTRCSPSTTKSIAWFYDAREPRRGGPDHGRRRASCRRTTWRSPTISCTRGKFFEPTGKVSKSQARRPGQVRCSSSATFRTASTIERLILPGVTQLTD